MTEKRIWQSDISKELRIKGKPLSRQSVISWLRRMNIKPNYTPFKINGYRPVRAWITEAQMAKLKAQFYFNHRK